MIGIVALLVAAGLAVVLWRLVASQSRTPGRSAELSQTDTATDPTTDAAADRGRPAVRTRRDRRPVVLAPDDDPEFLAELARRNRPDDQAR